MAAIDSRLADALRRNDFVILDGWCPEWQWRAISEAEKDGLVHGQERHCDDQYTAIIYRLTAAGREALERRNG